MSGDSKTKYKIGDVCKKADVQPYVLRYWETEFPALAPDKSGGGQRTYSNRDIEVIMRIKELLYTEGFTIAGAKKKLEAELSEDRSKKPTARKAGKTSRRAVAMSDDKTAKVIKEVSKELRELLTMLKQS